MTGPTLAVDIGGSFTDLVGRLADGRLVTAKVPSTPDDPARALINGVEELASAADIEPAAFTLLLHGTTVATNAVLQRRGAVTALITTEGFRDVLQIARQSRPRLFDLDSSRSEPLVPRALRIEIKERIDVAGNILVELDPESIEAAAAQLRAAGVEAVAICLLHSYVSPAHELAVADALAERLPGAQIVTSSSVVREYREYERSSTTAINAYVAPMMTRYLSSMADGLAAVGMRGELRVMQSNGGLMSVERAKRLPAATVMSGVAAGAVGGVAIGTEMEAPAIVTLDMGGTSSDMALAVDGKIRAVRTHALDDLPIRLPALDVHSIGAGGGSIAYLDGRGLRVGPRSAGAVPGPAAYGHGGVEPTVTDADFVLGRLPEFGLLGGRLPLHRDLAEAAIRKIAAPLGLGIEEAAEGIVQIVNATMARQIRVLTVERGVDPRSCALVAFGGGGPTHAAELALELGMRRIVIPPNPGLTSAVGLLLSDIRADAVQTALLEIRPEVVEWTVVDRLARLFAEAEDSAVVDLPRIERREITVTREVEARYRRQGHELRVAAPSGPVDADFVAAVREAFTAAHRTRYGYTFVDEPIVVVNVVVIATVPFAASLQDLAVGTVRGSELAPLAAGQRSVMFAGARRDTAIYSRDQLAFGQRVMGPAIVQQYDATTVVPPEVTCTVANHGILLLDLP